MFSFIFFVFIYSLVVGFYNPIIVVTASIVFFIVIFAKNNFKLRLTRSSKPIFWILVSTFLATIVGLIKGNNFFYIINYSAPFMVLLFPLTIGNFRPSSINKIFTLLVNLTLFASLVSLIKLSLVLASLKFNFFLWGDTMGAGVEGSFRALGVYNFLAIAIVPALLFSSKLDLNLMLPRVLHETPIFLIRIYAILVLICNFILIASSAFLFVFLSLLVAYLLRLLINRSNVFVFAFPLVIILLSIMAGSYYQDLIFDGFSQDDVGNIKRYMISDAMINNLSFLGSGSGSLIPIPDLASSTAPYSTELSYHNLLYKFGVFIILFMPLAYDLFKFTYEGIVQSNFAKLFLAGSSYYLFFAISNPLLLNTTLLLFFSLSFVCSLHSQTLEVSRHE